MAGNTGPTSSAGKAKVSKNALKHGLRANKWLSDEEKLDFEALVADLEAEYQPSTATQRILMERIAMCMSKLRRLHGIEDALFYKARIDNMRAELRNRPESGNDVLDKIHATAMPSLKQVDVLARYQTTLERQLSKSIGELMVLKNNEQLALPNIGSAEL